MKTQRLEISGYRWLSNISLDPTTWITRQHQGPTVYPTRTHIGLPPRDPIKINPEELREMYRRQEPRQLTPLGALDLWLTIIGKPLNYSYIIKPSDVPGMWAVYELIDDGRLFHSVKVLKN